jgi:sugar phosphate isomerase/epimerase
LDLPARIAAFGIRTLEICHFHLPTRDAAYLNELRSALDSAGVELFTILIDDGDITHPEHGKRDQAWISGWLETAGQLGARCSRVIAGKTTGEEALGRSLAAMSELVDVAESNGVRLMTENWFGVFADPTSVQQVMEPLAGRAGLCFDFGNWKGANKYDDLAQITQYAESCHAKCSFTEPLNADREDYLRCLDLTRAANFSGPYTLIYDGPDNDEWAGLSVERDMVAPYTN